MFDLLLVTIIEHDNMIDGATYRGEYIADLPKTAGIYAWYFSPDFMDFKSNAAVFSQIARHAEVDYELAVYLKYGVKALSKGRTSMRYGRESEMIESVLSENVKIAGPLLESLIDSKKFPVFSRPLYIGIARNLYKRVYEQHFRKMSEYWDVRSGVSTCIANNSGCSVQQVMDKTSEPHSFALEARVKEVPVRDLVVVVHEMPNLNALDIGMDEEIETDDLSRRRSLERLLHLLTDPIFGRR